MTIHEIFMFFLKYIFSIKSKNFVSHFGDMAFQVLDGTP